MERAFRKLGKVLVGWEIILFALTIGCVTTEEVVPQVVVLPMTEHELVVEKGGKVSFPDPLPDYYPLHSVIDPDDIIAHGWDFGKDGKIDKIEVITRDGDVIQKLYDFTGQGQVDHKEDFEQEDVRASLMRTSK